MSRAGFDRIPVVGKRGGVLDPRSHPPPSRAGDPLCPAGGTRRRQRVDRGDLLLLLLMLLLMAKKKKKSDFEFPPLCLKRPPSLSKELPDLSAPPARNRVSFLETEGISPFLHHHLGFVLFYFLVKNGGDNPALPSPFFKRLMKTEGSGVTNLADGRCFGGAPGLRDSTQANSRLGLFFFFSLSLFPLPRLQPEEEMLRGGGQPE